MYYDCFIINIWNFRKYLLAYEFNGFISFFIDQLHKMWYNYRGLMKGADTMNIREIIENKENLTLSEFAAKSVNSKGREIYEEPDEMRTCYARDRDRIIHSHAFRREKHKTQVFILPNNDHIMDRLTHTLEVNQVAKTIAVALSLNETLAEAIALGHDTAHTCFGHAGESALNELSKKYGKHGYSHAEEAKRRLNLLSGLNLTTETMDGILKHSGLSNTPSAITLEGQIAPFADKIAYLTSDFENAISMGLIGGFEELPKEITNTLGLTKREMINTLIKSIINNSYNKPFISMDEEIYEAFKEFREFNFKNIYYNPVLVESNKRCKLIVNSLFEYYLTYPDKLPEITEKNDMVQSVIDYISGMTDKYALEKFNSLL